MKVGTTLSGNSPRKGIWRSLRRITSTGRYIPEIDGLRFIAVITVIFFHIARLTWTNCSYCTPLHRFPMVFLNRLDRGVPLFFMISGFILGLPFANHLILNGKPVALGAYFLRRVTRLEPPYIVNLLIRFPFVPWAKHVTWTVAAAHLGFSVLYLHSLHYGEFSLIHIPSWSLEVEVQFYLLAPLLATLFFSKNAWLRRGGLLLTILAFSLVRTHFPEDVNTMPNLSILSWIQYFLAGFLLADWYLTGGRKLKSSWRWDVSGLCALIAGYAVTPAISYLLLPFLFGIFVIASFKGVVVNRFLCYPFVATAGGMCYSFYLTHSLVVETTMWVMLRLHMMKHVYWQSLLYSSLIAVPIIFVVGTIFYVLIERPCMDKAWPQKLAAFILRRRPRPATSAVTT